MPIGTDKRFSPLLLRTTTGLIHLPHANVFGQVDDLFAEGRLIQVERVFVFLAEKFEKKDTKRKKTI